MKYIFSSIIRNFLFTWTVPLVKQDPIPFRSTWVHPQFYGGICVADHLVLCVVFCLPLLVFFSFFFWSLYCLSLSLYCLSFGHCIVCLLVIVLFVFWSLHCLSFGYCIVCLLVIVLFVFLSLYCLSFDHCIVCFSIDDVWLPLCYL